MPRNRRPNRPTWLEAAAFAGNFLLVPLWDAYALFAALRAAWRALPSDRRTIANLALTAPVRRLIMLAAAYGLAWAGFGAVLGAAINQPGPFGVLVTGLAHLPGGAASTAIAPGEPAAALIAPALPVTLKLLAASIVLAGVMILVLLGIERGLERLTARRERAGRAAALMWWLATGALAVPAGAAGLLAVMILGVRLGLLPAVAGTSGRGLMAAALVVAMLPALVAARASQREETGASLPGMAAGEAFFSQAGWLLSSTIAAEVVFGLDGAGALLVEAISRGDAAVVVGVVRALAPVLLVLHARAVINQSAREALLPEPRVEAEPAAAPSARGWLRPALGLLLTVLPLLIAVVWLPQQAAPADHGAVYERASAAHPFGTDAQGRDVRGTISAGILEAAAAAGLGGVVALGLGGWWGGLARLLANGRRAASAWLADLVLLPATAAMLIHPVGVALLLKAATSGLTTGTPVLWLGAAVGLLLVPRAARAAARSGMEGARSDTSPGYVVAGLVGAILAAFLYSQVVGMAWAGLPGGLPGTLLAAPRELIAGAQVIPGGPYLRLAVMLAAPGAVMSVGLYLLQDALISRFAPRQAEMLAGLLG